MVLEDRLNLYEDIYKITKSLFSDLSTIRDREDIPKTSRLSRDIQIQYS